MRLTLRTLLAYLDDTLEPLMIKQIGQKVSESDTAQELISRIKQVTRRRRLTTPPATGPNSFDPNTVAEYLDSELGQEQIAELEKICLESDVHLAEVASCHQILTLVLGEPDSAPPPAKERMYALVRGREAIPFRKATAAGDAATSPSSADHDADEMFLLGLPFYRRGSWLRWALPLAGVLLLVVVGVAIWQLIYSSQLSTSPEVAQNQKANSEQGDKTDNANAKGPNKKAEEDNPKGSGGPKKIDDKESDTPTKEKQGNEKGNGGTTIIQKPDKSSEKNSEQPSDKKTDSSPAERSAKPSNEYAAVGRYHTAANGPPSLLAHRKSARDVWHRVAPGSSLYSTEQLVSLPGYASEVRLDCGAHLLLRGLLREFTQFMELKGHEGELYHLQESAIMLHKPQGTDADLTLDRGRLYISNHHPSNPVVVRLRFEQKVWDLTLQPEAEVVVDLSKKNRADIDYRKGQETLKEVNLFLLRGQAGLALEDDHYPKMSIPGWAYFIWNSQQPAKYHAQQIDKASLDQIARKIFAKVPPTGNPIVDGMERALSALSQRMFVDSDCVTVLQEVLQNAQDRPQHYLALYSMAALDAVEELIGVLREPDAIHAPDRDIAVIALRRWLDRSTANNRKLYDPETSKGLLVQKFHYTSGEAERIVELLHDFTVEQFFKPEIYEHLARDLLSEKVPIAELARWHLFRLAQLLRVNLPALKDFNAAASRTVREKAVREVFDRIADGTLPPAMNTPGSRGAPGKGVPPKNGGGKVPQAPPIR